MKKNILLITILLLLPNVVFAKEITNKRALAAIDRLERLYALLEEYGLGQYITFDLGMLSKFNYYTGIIFRAYTSGTGDAIATGGRYDSLVGQFGKDAPAIGMAVMMNQLLLALARQKLLPVQKAENTLIVYQEEFRSQAIAMAKKMRSENKNVELYLESGQETDDSDYAARMGIGNIIYLRESRTKNY